VVDLALARSKGISMARKSQNSLHVVWSQEKWDSAISYFPGFD